MHTSHTATRCHEGSHAGCVLQVMPGIRLPQHDVGSVTGSVSWPQPMAFLTFLLDRSFFWVGIQNLACFGIGSVNGLFVSPNSQNWQQSSTMSFTIVSWIWNSLPKTTYQIWEVVQKLDICDLLWSVYPKVSATGHERYLKGNIANNVDWQKCMRFHVCAFNILPVAFINQNVMVTVLLHEIKYMTSPLHIRGVTNYSAACNVDFDLAIYSAKMPT